MAKAGDQPKATLVLVAPPKVIAPTVTVRATVTRLPGLVLLSENRREPNRIEQT